MKIFWTKVFRFLDILILKDFSRNFTSWSWSWCSFISLFTLDLESFSFHFSFSKWVNQISISLFTSRTSNIHSRRALVWASLQAHIQEEQVRPHLWPLPWQRDTFLGCSDHVADSWPGRHLLRCAEPHPAGAGRQKSSGGSYLDPSHRVNTNKTTSYCIDIQPTYIRINIIG